METSEGCLRRGAQRTVVPRGRTQDCLVPLLTGRFWGEWPERMWGAESWIGAGERSRPPGPAWALGTEARGSMVHLGNGVSTHTSVRPVPGLGASWCTTCTGNLHVTYNPAGHVTPGFKWFNYHPWNDCRTLETCRL